MLHFSSSPVMVVLVALAAFGAGVALAAAWFRRERRGFIVELRSLWDRLDAIFYRSPLAVSLCEPDVVRGELTVIDCNARACALHGGTREQVMAAPPRRLGGTPEEQLRAIAWLQAPRSEEIWHGEAVLRRLDEVEMPMLYECARVEIGGRELVLMVERDVSEQRRAEVALRESEQRFRQLVETADCLLWRAQVRDGDGGAPVWAFDVPRSGLRQRLFEAVGVPFREGMLWNEFNVPEFPAMEQRAMAALRADESSYRQEFRVLLPHETMWLQERVEIERTGPDEWNLIGVVVDITRLKETEAAMRISEERNRLVLAASNDGIWDYDVAGARMTFSERCRVMLGLTADDMPTTPEGWRARLHPDDVAEEAAAWKKYRGTGEPCVYQARFRHQDGSWRWFMVRAITVSHEYGGLKRIIGSHTDITELKRNDGELQQGRRLRAIGELVGGIAHEFNNLLTPMLLQTTMMRDGQAPGGDVKEQLKPVIDAITEARELTQRILTFGRRTTHNAEPLDLSAVVRDNLELLKHTIDRRVKLTVEPVAEALWICQNRTDVAQIVVNLVLNARDTLLDKLRSQPPAGWVPSIDVRFTTLDKAGVATNDEEPANATAKRWRRLTVADNGQGMNEAVRERIFEPFYTTKEVGHGTGLGLATVWHLIKTMGGQVEVETAPGEGSSFHVLLPATLPPLRPAPVDAPKVPPASGRTARVLLAEDQPEVASSLTRILQRWGHTVVAVSDGTAALAALMERGGDFDVCITDLNMPGATGFEIVQKIRERELGLRVIVMGGYLTAQVRRSLQELKIDSILPKPFAMADVAAVMRTCGY